ncbi:amidohydrolase [Hathewaya limosa]|uniref:Amidohydrolase n=1 Tax=Hathewaya limosa TaxID=1536 RepID=A0ABU0JP56_HATLI|nr:amidohydrolase [Hathewaya limosa]MDQ0478866.1 amidohydrolase [Hathewaya limosa]
MQEFETQKRVIEELDKMEIPYKKVGNTSIVATIKGNKQGKIIALRADLDALPIKEESCVEFSSKNEGLMHACGHDAHTAMLLGAAKILIEMKDEIKGTIKLIFQEGEEIFNGAKQVIKSGEITDVDACFGLHCMQTFETGYINIEPGYRMAGCDTIYVKFKGVSGHGSSPHLAKDTIYPACTFVSGLQAIATKNIDPQEPIILTVGKFMGGTKANIIPKYTSLDISMRYFNPKVREIVHESIKRHAKAIAEAYEINSVYVFVTFHRMGVGVVKNALQNEFGIGAAEYANIGSMYFYAYFIMQIPSGVLADKLGPKKTVSIFSVLAAIGSIIFGMAPNIIIA